METRPIAPETWEKLPPEVQAYLLYLENALRQSLERIAQLEQRVNELEARLNRHSGNSSQPPSQDPPQAPKNRGEKSGRHPGGQVGHQGNHRELAPPEKVHKIVEHRAETCPHCRSALKQAAARQAPPVERRQVWELPEIRPVITEHRLVPGWCGYCRAWVKPELPAAVGRSTFGPRLQAWVAILTGRFRQSRRQLTFAMAPGVEPTNNRAERALRGAVLWRKGCFGNQSDNGSRFTARILTAVATLRQQNRDIVEYVVTAIQAHRTGQSAPSLLPVDLLLVEAA